MSTQTPPPRRSDRPRPVIDASLASLVAFPLVLVALLVVASYPLVAAAVLSGTALATKVAQIALAALVSRTSDAPRRFTVPGVGTVTISLAPA